MSNKKDIKDKDNPLKDNGLYLFMKGIDEGSAEDLIEYILSRNYNPNGLEEINLVINSPGGSVNSVFAMIDVIKGSKIPVNTIGIGCIASAALMLFLTGKVRTVTIYTSILSHAYSWASWGKYHDLIADRKEQDLTALRIIEHYKECTGLDEGTIRNKLLPHQDVWLSAEEAKEMNICNRIISRFKI